MNEIKFTNKIRLALNEGARVDARVAERLHAARERALSMTKPERAPAFAWAHSTAAGMVGGFGGGASQPGHNALEFKVEDHE